MIGKAYSGLRRLAARIRGTVGSAIESLLSGGRVTVAGPSRRIGRARVWAVPGSSVRIGPDSVLVSSAGWNPVAASHKCSIRAVAAGASIEIGSGLRATGVTIAARTRVSLGSGVMAGSDVLIVDSDFHALGEAARAAGDPGESRPVTVGDGVFLGARCIVLKGVTIGNGAVIGAGAVVTNDVPANAIAAGNPARILHPRGEA